MYVPQRAQFDHIGLITTAPTPGARRDPNGRVWLTNPRQSLANIEWLCFELDSPFPQRIREEPHLAYRVPDLNEALAGQTPLFGPAEIGDGFMTIAFTDIEGALVEYMQYANPNEESWYQ
jgi:hypothetical protein